MDEYTTIESTAEGVFKDRKSRFVSLSFPISHEEDVKKLLAQVKKQYYDASHFCYAYRCLSANQEIMEHVNDDGEPANSAGIQILYVIRKFSLLNVFVVVLRYYGGIKLGVPGLINAYKMATHESLSAAKKTVRLITKRFQIDFSYDAMSKVMTIIKKHHCRIIHQTLELDCAVEVEIHILHSESMLSELSHVSPKINIHEII
jgi:uncharacterized YigZ family protein